VKAHENVRRIRIAKGVSPAHIYEGLGLSRQMYSRFELQGKGNNAEKFEAIGKLLGIDACTFFSDKLTESVIKKEFKAIGEYERLRNIQKESDHNESEDIPRKLRSRIRQDQPLRRSNGSHSLN